MAHADNMVTINATAERVFAFLADGTNNPIWRPDMLSIELASGMPGLVGATYRQQLKGPGGQAIPGDYKITASDQPSLLLSLS
jgi:hypothetical protein